MISENIKKYRLKSGLSLSELARSANISKAYLHQLETEKSTSPSVEKLSNIAGALGVNLNDLTGSEVIEPAKPQEGQQLPPSLKEAIEKYPEMDKYKDMLICIKMRGKYPKTPEDWYALFAMMKNTIRP